MAVMGRPRAFDRDEALEAAKQVFWRKGFAAASINDLCDAMGIRSPSLYAAFGSKEALYQEAMEHYVRVNGPTVWGELERGATAREGVENLLRAATRSLPFADDSPAGCMALLGGVGDDWPAAIADLARAVRISMLGHFRERFTAAVAQGELSTSTDIERLGRFYMAVLQGMAIQARDGATAKDLEGPVDAAMAAWPGDKPS